MTAQTVEQQLRTHRESLLVGLGVSSLSLFGSVARGMASEQNDVDILVDFDGPADFDRFMELKERLEGLLGRPVDLVTRKALRPALRPRIEREASVSREWRLYAGDIRDSCQRILAYTQGMNREKFLADSKTYDAIVRNIEIIGEAVKHLPTSLREADAQVRWDRVAALRNILAHS